MYFKGQCDIGHKLDLWIWCLRVIACSCKPVYAFHATILLQHFVVNMVPTFIQHFYCTTQICIAHTCCHNVSVCPLHAGIVSKRLKISLRAGVLPAVTHRRTSYNQIQYNETEPMLLKHWKHFRKKMCNKHIFVAYSVFVVFAGEYAVRSWSATERTEWDECEVYSKPACRDAWITPVFTKPSTTTAATFKLQSATTTGMV